MSESTRPDILSFEGGPGERLQRSLGLIKPDDRRVAIRVWLVLAVGWVPLAVLTAIQGYAIRSNPLESFLMDLGAYSRFLLAAPLFVFAESKCLPRLAGIVRHFIEAGLVPSSERAQFDRAVASTSRLLNSGWVDIIVLVLAYAIAISSQNSLSMSVMRWQSPAGAGTGSLSLAGWWCMLVSLPLLLILLLGWLWRILLWGRLMFLLSHVELRLIPAHPDLLGGLGTLGGSVRAFRLIGLAIGVSFAGPIANRVLYLHENPLDYKYVMAVLLAMVLSMCAGPLMVFIPVLRKTKKRGVYDYGTLANKLGRQFEDKWLYPSRVIGDDALKVTDFSATTDLYGIVANVRKMNVFPIGLKSLNPLLIATLLPFVPVFLIAIPLKELLKQLAKLAF